MTSIKAAGVQCPRRRPGGKKCGQMVASDDRQRMVCGTCLQTMSFEAVAAFAKAQARTHVAVAPEQSEQPWLPDFEAVPLKDAMQR